MRINYNVSSIIARNALNNNDKRVASSMQKLTSGCKISSAADNAAGLAIARRMNAQIKSLQQANQNANDGLSAMNTADGALSEMHDILQRMNELAIQSANGTNSNSDREMIQKEIDQLVAEADRIAKTTQFNAQNLLDGSFAFKAFTNSENVKVMSYSENVKSGTYVIGQLTYCNYEDTVKMYNIEEEKITDENNKIVDIRYNEKEGNITQNSHFEIDDKGMKLKRALVTSASVAAYKIDDEELKSFPDGARLTFDDDLLVIKADNDFEIKVKVNDRTPLGTPQETKVNSATTGKTQLITTNYAADVTGSSVVTTTSYSTVTKYRNIAVQGDDGKRYNFKELNFFENAYSDGTALGDDSKRISTRFDGDNGRDLRDDLAEFFKVRNPDCAIDITGVEYTGATTTDLNATFKIKYTATDGKTGETTTEMAEFSLYRDANDFGQVMNTQRSLKDYRYSETFTTRTKYEVGSGTAQDCLRFDLTGMGAMVVHVGANFGQYVELEIPALTMENLGLDGLDITTEESARLAIDEIGTAINQLSAVRAKIGAYSNRLERTITNLDTAEENITATYSRIMDVDMAAEMTEYSSSQVLVQAANSMLAQANERPQQVLQLLQ